MSFDHSVSHVNGDPKTALEVICSSNCASSLCGGDKAVAALEHSEGIECLQTCPLQFKTTHTVYLTAIDVEIETLTGAEHPLARVDNLVVDAVFHPTLVGIDRRAVSLQRLRRRVESQCSVYALDPDSRV